MCSWCHGFSPELDKIISNYPNLNLKLVMGGLRPFSKEKAIDKAEFLKAHWLEIIERTGQPFSFGILEDKEFIYDTEPASRAIIVARTMNPAIEYHFFKDVQMAFYRDNKNTNEVSTYLPIAAKNGLELNAFERFFNSEEIKTRTRADFHLTQQFGIKGFPSLILKHNGGFTQLSNGFNTAENINHILGEVIK